MKNAQTHFVEGLRWMAITRLGAQALTWLGTIYVMRQLVPQDYGLAAICTVVISIAAMASEFGIAAGIVQAPRLERPQLRSVFGASIIFSFAGAAIVAGLAPLLASFFRAPEATPLIRTSALQLALAPLASMSDAQLRRELRFKSSSVIDLSSAIATTAATAGLAWHGAGVWSLILGPLGGSLLRLTLLNALAPLRMWPSFDLRPAREIIGFGFQVAMSRIASFVFGQSDVLIAGRLLPKSELGEYSVAMHLAMLPVSKAMGVLNQVAYPVVAQLNRQQVAMSPYVLQGLRLTAYAVIPVLWGLAALSHWLVPVLLGPGWSGAILPLQIVALALPLRLLSVVLSSVIQGMGRADLDLHNSLTGVVLMPICFLVGAHFGTQGLAVSWLVGLPLLVGLNLHRSREVLGVGVRALLSTLARPVCLSAIQGSVVLATASGTMAFLAPWATIAVSITAAMLTYLGLLWTLDRPSALQLLRLVRPGMRDPDPQ